MLDLGPRERVPDDREARLERPEDDPDQREQEEDRDVGDRGTRQQAARQAPAGATAPRDGAAGCDGLERRSCPGRPSGDRAVSRTSTNEIANISVAIDAASAGRNWFASWKMNTGAVSVLPERFPETRTTLPNSPMHRAKVSRPRRRSRVGSRGKHDLPEREPGARAERGRGLLLRRIQLEEHGLHLPNHQRQRDDAQRQEDPDRRERDLDAEPSRNLPIGELGPYRVRSISPVTSVGIAIGRSTTADSTRRPGNR